MYSSIKHRLHVCLVQQVVALLHKVVKVAVRSEASPQFIAGPLEYIISKNIVTGLRAGDKYLFQIVVMALDSLIEQPSINTSNQTQCHEYNCRLVHLQEGRMMR